MATACQAKYRPIDLKVCTSVGQPVMAAKSILAQFQRYIIAVTESCAHKYTPVRFLTLTPCRASTLPLQEKEEMISQEVEHQKKVISTTKLDLIGYEKTPGLNMQAFHRGSKLAVRMLVRLWVKYAGKAPYCCSVSPLIAVHCESRRNPGFGRSKLYTRRL